MEQKINFLESYSFVKNPDIKIFNADEIKQIPKTPFLNIGIPYLK